MIAENTRKLPRSEGYKSAPKDWEAETFLMRRFNTEAIRVVIPVVGELEDDDVRASSLASNLE